LIGNLKNVKPFPETFYTPYSLGKLIDWKPEKTRKKAKGGNRANSLLVREIN